MTLLYTTHVHVDGKSVSLTFYVCSKSDYLVGFQFFLLELLLVSTLYVFGENLLLIQTPVIHIFTFFMFNMCKKGKFKYNVLKCI